MKHFNNDNEKEQISNFIKFSNFLVLNFLNWFKFVKFYPQLKYKNTTQIQKYNSNTKNEENQILNCIGNNIICKFCKLV